VVLLVQPLTIAMATMAMIEINDVLINAQIPTSFSALPFDYQSYDLFGHFSSATSFSDVAKRVAS
jgi:hypothetical protein